MMFSGDEFYGDEITSGLTFNDRDPCAGCGERPCCCDEEAEECPECFDASIEGVRIKVCEGCGFAWDDATGRPVPPSRVSEIRRRAD